MTLEDTVNQLESRLNNLQNAFLQSQKTQVPVTAKTDVTAIRVEAVTPWTATKTAYIDDTECIFEGIPQGNVTVYCSVPHTVEKQDGRVVVKFESLTEVIDITISIL
jgi:methylmalonyl-CoA mutase N-terminal domain/subunit